MPPRLGPRSTWRRPDGRVALPMAPNPLLRPISAARRELLRSVERAAEVDLRPGHCREAARRARAVQEEAARLIATLDRRLRP